MDTYGFGSSTRIRRDRHKYFSISVITKLAFHFTGTAKKRSKRNAIRNTKAIARNKNGERLMKKLSQTIIQADCC